MQTLRVFASPNGASAIVSHSRNPMCGVTSSVITCSIVCVCVCVLCTIVAMLLLLLQILLFGGTLMCGGGGRTRTRARVCYIKCLATCQTSGHHYWPIYICARVCAQVARRPGDCVCVCACVPKMLTIEETDKHTLTQTLPVATKESSERTRAKLNDKP